MSPSSAHDRQTATPPPATRARRPSPGASATDPLIGDLRRGGLLPLLVLLYVGRGPCYGNQLRDRISALTNGALRVNPNTMYPMLRTLESRGLIAGAWEHPERRTRRFYRITPAGRRERDRLAGELEARLDRIAGSIEAIRSELAEPST